MSGDNEARQPPPQPDQALGDADMASELLVSKVVTERMKQLGDNAAGLGAVEPRGAGYALLCYCNAFFEEKRAKHIALGLEPYDAVIATARERAGLTPEQLRTLVDFLAAPRGEGPP